MTRKIFITLLSLVLFIAIIPLSGNFHSVKAEQVYPMACDLFEVSYIEDDGSLSKVSCHSSYNDARKVMVTNEDYVIRHASSMSPTKIIGMNSGVAYTYPGRLENSILINIYQDYKHMNVSTYKQTYVTEHYEMTYYNTATYASDGSGFVRVTLNGFEGFAKLQEVDLVPTKYLTKAIPLYLGGNNQYTNEKMFLVKVHQNYYALEKNGKYTDLVFHFFRGYGKNGEDCLSYSLHCDNGENYPFMELGKKYYSNDGINFYSDSKLMQYVGTTYNYYQFLPVRSTTDISASTFDKFLKSVKSSSVMENMGQTYVDYQNKYGVNALIMYSISCLESAYGTSDYAVKHNNLFGWSVYDDNTSAGSTFTSVSACIKEMMGRNLRWFMDYTNKRYYGTCVGNKGAGFNVNYASDPYWGVKIASIAYSIDKYANGSSGNLTDFNKYTIGFVKNNYNDVLYDSSIEWDPKIYKDAYSDNILYTGRYGSHYQKDLTVILLEEVNNRYKIQSTNNVFNNEIVTDDGIFDYDWQQSVGYINKTNVIVLNEKSVPGSNQSLSTYDPIVSVRKVELTDSSLTINGVAAIQGMNFSSENNIKHEVVFYDLSNESKFYSFTASTIDSLGFDLDDGWDYSYAGFNLNINLPNDQLPAGSYVVKIKITNRNKVVENILYTIESKYKFAAAKNETQTYRASMNEMLRYRLELDILNNNNDVDFTTIYKPSKRTSLVTLDSVDVKNNTLEIQGHGFIHYLDYSNKDNVSFDLYLLDEKGNSVQFNTSLIENSMDYTDLFSYDYNLDNISFKSQFENIFDLEGNYTAYLIIRNGEYKDILELPFKGVQFDDVVFEQKTVGLTSSSIRNRLMVHVY